MDLEVWQRILLWRHLRVQKQLRNQVVSDNFPDQECNLQMYRHLHLRQTTSYDLGRVVELGLYLEYLKGSQL